MEKTVVGFPRIGADRELKFWTEQFFAGILDESALSKNAELLRAEHEKAQLDAGIDLFTVNDFSFYDGMLDMAYLLGAVPSRFRSLSLSPLKTYFAMARGYQGEKGEVKALSMRKWFNTNYHYIVPEIGDDTVFGIDEKAIEITVFSSRQSHPNAKPVFIGPMTFLKLSNHTGGKNASDYVEAVVSAYASLFERYQSLSTQWLQIDEPILVTDPQPGDMELFRQIYRPLLSRKGHLKILLQTYFGDVRDYYESILNLDFDGVGLDFVEGKNSFDLLEAHGLRDEQTLFAGLVNGKNVWINNYSKTLSQLDSIRRVANRVVLSTSCSLLHVPYSTEREQNIPLEERQQLAFAQEKLRELKELAVLAESEAPEKHPFYIENSRIHEARSRQVDASVQRRVNALNPKDFQRTPGYDKRVSIQKEHIQLPILPTTTIGSFPRTPEVTGSFAKYRQGKLSENEIRQKIDEWTTRWIGIQEDIGLDVLVHGEFERTDMVAYFAEHFNGFRHTAFAWVQSYGTRCVRPPIIIGDVSRPHPFTVDAISRAQRETSKPVKGMLTGPVTILNWSFPREDLTLRQIAIQIALAIRDEVLDLEKSGVAIIQIDEAALREKLPLRLSDRQEEYLDWAIPAFRLAHSGVKPETQIHTHMCYSEFRDIIGDIESMDVDVISFEAARSDFSILEVLEKRGFQPAVGPGIYDIHSPRIPTVEELVETIEKIARFVPIEKLWINPDCGLKTRGEKETIESLNHLAVAAAIIREKIRLAQRTRDNDCPNSDQDSHLSGVALSKT